MARRSFGTLQLTAANSYTSVTDITISAWLKSPHTPASTYTGQPVCFNLLNTDGPSFSYSHSNATYRQSWIMEDQSGFPVSKYATSLQANTWYHILFTFNNTTKAGTSYLNGAADGPGLTAAHQIQAGSALVPSAFWNGSNANDQEDCSIADYAIWSTVLTADEITALASGIRPNEIRPTALRVYYPLWGTNLATEADLGGTANNATVANYGITPIQHNQATGSLSLAFANANKAGNLLVLGVGMNVSAPGGSVSVTDTLGNTWVAASTFQNVSLGGTQRGLQMFYAANSLAGSNTATVHLSGFTQSYVNIVIAEIAGAAQSSPLDGSGAEATGSSAAASSGNYTVTVGDLLLGFALFSSGSITAGSGWLSLGTDTFFMLEWKVASSTTANAAFTGSSSDWAAQGAAFLAFPGATDPSIDNNPPVGPFRRV